MFVAVRLGLLYVPLGVVCLGFLCLFVCVELFVFYLFVSFSVALLAGIVYGFTFWFKCLPLLFLVFMLIWFCVLIVYYLFT